MANRIFRKVCTESHQSSLMSNLPECFCIMLSYTIFLLIVSVSRQFLSFIMKSIVKRVQVKWQVTRSLGYLKTFNNDSMQSHLLRSVHGDPYANQTASCYHSDERHKDPVRAPGQISPAHLPDHFTIICPAWKYMTGIQTDSNLFRILYSITDCFQFLKCHTNLCTFSTHSFQKHVNILVCCHLKVRPSSNILNPGICTNPRISHG